MCCVRSTGSLPTVLAMSGLRTSQSLDLIVGSSGVDSDSKVVDLVLSGGLLDVPAETDLDDIENEC